MSKHCSVACDTPEGMLRCELQLPASATVADALAAARAQLGEHRVDWEGAPVAIFGQIVTRQQVPAEGDRIELLRRLPSDPRVARRARVGAGPGPGRSQRRGR